MPTSIPSPDIRPARERIRRWEHRAILAVFLAGLWLPLLIQPTGWDPAAGLGRGEKRKPVPFPALGGPDWTLRGFTRGLDAWCGDHFGLRRTLILANSLLDYRVFGVSPVPSVVPGREGWLFYAGDIQGNDGNPIWDFRGIRPLSPYSLERLRWMLQDQHEWLAERGILYLFVLVPAKEEVHDAFLPAHITRAGPFTPREQLLRHLRARAPEIPVLDLTPSLREAARGEPCFLKTDTHWNAWGGLVGTRTILARLQAWFPAMTLPRAEDFERQVKRDLGGDLAAQMALDAFLLEDYLGLFPRTPRRSQPRPLHTGEDPDIEAETGDASLPRAVIYRDSYANILVPTLSEHFQWVRFVWGRTGTEMRGVEGYRPDVVLQIMADRALRLPLRYSAGMQRERLAARFEASDRVLLRLETPDSLLEQLRPAASSELMFAPEGVVLRTRQDEEAAADLPGLGGVSSVFLPILRLRLISPKAGDLQVSWRNARTGERVRDRINLRRGGNDLYLALYDPELAGAVRLAVAREFSGLVIQSLEIRGHPR
jgi:hypothetical protein